MSQIVHHAAGKTLPKGIGFMLNIITRTQAAKSESAIHRDPQATKEVGSFGGGGHGGSVLDPWSKDQK